MKITALASVALLFFSSLASQAADTYDFDPAHSTLGFKIRHLFSDVSGRFNDFTGKVILDEAAPEKSTVDVSIKTDSIDTANVKRAGTAGEIALTQRMQHQE
ncbi:MAG: YceI family protein [Gloeobacteraceae cyanobacterium ES-bin-144]|nr:YceI family protein [Verrucomicrobiales bacterium]